MTTWMKGATITILGMILAWPALSGAQQQPAGATNAQDERVNVNIDPSGEWSDLKILRSDDKQETSQYISYMLELEHAPVFEVLPFASRAVALEKGAVKSLKYNDPVGGKERNFLQIITTRDQMDSVIETIRKIDLPQITSSTGTIKTDYRLAYRRASEVAAIVQRSSGSSELKIHADDVTNTIFIEDSPSDIEREFLTIQFYDVPPPQVEFEVRIVEIDEDKSGEVGLDWDAWKNVIGGQINVTGNYFEGGSSFNRLDYLVTLDARVLADFLNYTVQTGTARVVTHSTITATNNLPGVLSSFRRVIKPDYVAIPTPASNPRVVTETAPGVTATYEEDRKKEAENGTRTVYIVPQTTNYRVERPVGEEGLFMLIQPTIAREMVTARIEVDVNSIAGFTPMGEPQLSQRHTQTTVTLKDGDPLHISGLKRETSANVRKGIPGLKDLPWIRVLASVERQITRESRLFILITPRFKSQILTTQPLIMGSKFVDPPAMPSLAPNPAAAAKVETAEAEGPEGKGTEARE